MKSKGGPTFFEVLRTTFNEQKSSTSIQPAVQTETPPPPQAVPVIVDPAVEEIEPPPAPPAPQVVTPPLPPVVVQAPQPAPEPIKLVEKAAPAAPVAEQKFDPDTRFIKVTQTSALFAALIAVMALLGSFLLGMKVGKGMAALPAGGQQVKMPYAIKAAEWPFKDAAEQKEMQRSAEYFRAEFEKLGVKDARVLALPTKYVLLVGKFADPAEARKILDDVRRYRYSTPSGYKEIFKTAELVKTE